MSILNNVIGDKEVKTEAVKALVKSITGENPIIDRSNPNVNVIKFTPKQKELVVKYFAKGEQYVIGKDGKKQTKKSNVIIEHKPLWVPIIIKKAIPYIIGTLAVGYLAGRYIK